MSEPFCKPEDRPLNYRVDTTRLVQLFLCALLLAVLAGPWLQRWLLAGWFYFGLEVIGPVAIAIVVLVSWLILRFVRRVSRVGQFD